MAALAEFIFNNMFWDEKTEDIDKVKLAFFFGDIIASKERTEKEQEQCQQDTPNM